MRIIKCDYCGAEIEDGGKNNTIPSDNGWTTLHGTKMCSRWEKDVCPMCQPTKKKKPMKQPKTNREAFNGN